jgi:sarcosine oxidase
MKTSYEHIVLGLGGIGSGALYWLSRQAGKEVLGLEQFEIGHVRGGSQDHSRIIRLSYHTPNYVRLAKGAYQAWAELEADAGEKLIVKTGGIDLFPANGDIPMSNYTTSMDAEKVPYERLTAHETMSRWSQWQLNDDVQVLYQAETGIAPAAKCNAAHLRMAQAHGATVRDNVPVTSVKAVGDEVEIEAGGVGYKCRHLTIAAGAWSNNILKQFGQEINLTVTQEQVIYFNTPHVADFAPDRFPVWIWMDDPCFYGFPTYGEAGPKAAEDAGGKPTTADTRTFTPDPDNTQRLNTFMQKYLPTAYGPPILTKTCLYTMPPDRDFVLDILPNQPNITVAIGAGHAFKYASVLGRILSQLATDGTTAHDMTPYSIKRPILFEENPTNKFMT